MRTSVKCVAALLPLATLSCVSGSVIVPEPGTRLAAATPIRCPEGGLTNGDSALQAGFALAWAEACKILQSTNFRQTVEGLALARACPAFFFSKHKLLPGREIYAVLSGGLPAEVRVSGEDLKGSTVAVTVASDGSMVIEPWKLRDWASASKEQRAATVNTLVHEMTHLVRDADGSSYFQDGWQWAPWCDPKQLASYRLGDEAEAQWLERSGSDHDPAQGLGPGPDARAAASNGHRTR